MNKKANQQGFLALTILAMMALVTGISFAGFAPTSSVMRSADCPNGPMKADLTGTDINGKTPSGKVEFNSKRTNNLSVKVKSISVPKDTALSVFVGDTNVGQITVSSSGNGELKLDSATVTEGSIISVKNGETILLTGSFACTANSSTKTPKPTATVAPTEEATVVPTTTPTEVPTVTPTEVPATVTPTPTMTATPTPTPTETPTIAPPLPM